jgi:hypothetical protein
MGESIGEISMVERKNNIHTLFVSTVGKFKQLQREGKTTLADEAYEEIASLRDAFAELVFETKKYGTILSKMDSNIRNIFRGTAQKPEQDKKAMKESVSEDSPAKGMKGAKKAKAAKKKAAPAKKKPSSNDL